MTVRFVTAVGLRARTFGGNFLTSIAVGGKILRASGQKTKATVPVSYLHGELTDQYDYDQTSCSIFRMMLLRNCPRRPYNGSKLRHPGGQSYLYSVILYGRRVIRPATSIRQLRLVTGKKFCDLRARGSTYGCFVT